uniref:DNA-(apurinic or apyrimidinic site) lyase n=1 Tax=Crassostrea virginica TaxID=6565 RepID=A0A8B8C1C6_CRAVI|nr:endonuclease 8-like 3 isoform X2 [Crassostrea virginica]
MVEGPGCKIKGEKIKSKLINQTVKTVSGNAVDREIKPKKGVTVSQFDVLTGRTLTEVLTLGKELFMFFGDVCLRVHFLMAGSFRVNGQALDKDYGKLTETPSLQVNFNADVLTFYKSAAQIRDSESCRTRYNDLNDLDICSPVFNHQRAVAMVMEQTDRQVCDVLLDQSLLPGVGNIIKNEALFDSGIKPSSKCRKTGSNLNQYMKIYNKRKCGQCEGKVTITRIGEDSERVTYYCPQCQNNTLRSQVKVLPCKNSLLGWVQSASQKTHENSTNQKTDGNSTNQKTDGNSTNQKTEEEWTCPFCTLINKGTQLSCEACLAERAVTESDKGKLGLKRKSSTSLDCSEQKTKRLKGSVNDCDVSTNDSLTLLQNGQHHSGLSGYGNSHSASPHQLKHTAGVNTKAGSKHQQLVNANKSGVNSNAGSKNKELSNNQYNTNKTQKTNVRGSAVQMTGGTAQQGQGTSKIPWCPGHSKPCSMTQSRKKGDNYLRWFFTCGVYPRSKQCKFFKWADESFPICPNHGKPAAFRTVMKEGPNNGRKFFACPLPKQKQCGYFEWAEGF